MPDKTSAPCYTLGIDIGSTACKAVILKNGLELMGTSVIEAGTGTSGPSRAFSEVLQSAGLFAEDLAYTIATGYGRMTFVRSDSQISELSCHAKGVFFLNPKVRTIIDIGGQDAKTLRLNARGTMTGFVMNDKCAAGTGRFLDVMAKILEVDVSELAALSEKAEKAVSISNVCTVFAESEVISRLAAGITREDVAAGIHMSVANRVASLAKRAGIEEEVVMTGGVAQNAGVVKAMSEVLGIRVVPSPMAQLTGALGAAIIAFGESQKREENET